MEKMRKLNMTKTKGVIPLPLSLEFSRKNVENIRDRIKKLVEENGGKVEILNSDLSFTRGDTGLMSISGNVEGNVNYHLGESSVRYGAPPSRPAYIDVDLIVPDRNYNSMEKSLTKILHPVRSAIFRF